LRFLLFLGFFILDFFCPTLLGEKGKQLPAKND